MFYYGLLLFIIFEYIRPGRYLPLIDALRLPTILALSLFVMSLVFSKTVSNGAVFKNSNTKWFIFFLSLISISVLTADVTLYAFKRFTQVLGYVFLYFVIIKQVHTLNRMKGFFAILILAHIVIIFLSPDIIFHPETRSYLSQSSFLGDGNDFSLSLVIVLPLCLFLFLEEKSKTKRLIYLSVILLLTLCIIGTSSRGGSLALASIILYLWLKSRKKIWGVVCILLLIWTVLLFASPTYFERMETIRDYESESSAMGRIMVWKAAINMALDHPILGVGAGQFPMHFGHGGYKSEDNAMPGSWTTAHSIYFLALGELGFPGIIFLLSIIISNLRSNGQKILGLKRYGTDLAVTHQRLFISFNASLIGFAVGGAFLSALYYPHLYILTGLFVSGNFIYKNNFLSLTKLEELEGGDSSHLNSQ